MWSSHHDIVLRIRNHVLLSHPNLNNLNTIIYMYIHKIVPNFKYLKLVRNLLLRELKKKEKKDTRKVVNENIAVGVEDEYSFIFRGGYNRVECENERGWWRGLAPGPRGCRDLWVCSPRPSSPLLSLSLSFRYFVGES